MSIFKHPLSIKAWHQPERRVWTKVISVVIAAAFIFPYLTWAFEPGNLQSGWNAVFLHNQPIEIPEKFCAITQSFQGKERLVVHIQDLHCNYEVQTNIARLIHWLAKQYGLHLVTVEGAALPVNTTQIRTFPIKKVREEVSDYFVRQGKISGSEHYAATGKYPIRLEGIETTELYQANKKSIEFILNNEGQGYCHDLRAVLNELKPDIYNSLLLKFDRKCSAFKAGKLGLPRYSAYLHKTAKALRIDLTPFPGLSRYVSQYQKLFSASIDPDQLFNELDVLNRVIRQNYYTHEEQPKLDQLEQRLDIIEKLINISVSPEELAEFRRQAGAFAVQKFLDFIRQYVPDSKLKLDPGIYILDQYINEASNFYQAADQRSRHFVDNLLFKMGRYQEDIAILVTGGFHTDQVLSELKKNSISYISLKPRITHYDLVNPYFALLKNQRTPLEKLLARNQNIFTLEPYLPQMSNPDDIPNPAQDLNERERVFSRLLELFLKARSIVHLCLQNKIGQELEHAFNQVLSEYSGGTNNTRIDLDQLTVYQDHILSFPLRWGDNLNTLAVAWRGQKQNLIEKEDALQTAEFGNGNVNIAVINPNKLENVQAKLKKQDGVTLASLSLLRLPALYLGLAISFRTGLWLRRIIARMRKAYLEEKPLTKDERGLLENLFQKYNIQDKKSRQIAAYYIAGISRAADTSAKPALDTIAQILDSPGVTKDNLLQELKYLSQIAQTSGRETFLVFQSVKSIQAVCGETDGVRVLKSLSQITQAANSENVGEALNQVKMILETTNANTVGVLEKLAQISQTTSGTHLVAAFKICYRVFLFLKKHHPEEFLTHFIEIGQNIDPAQVDTAFQEVFDILAISRFLNASELVTLLTKIVHAAGPAAGVAALQSFTEFSKYDMPDGKLASITENMIDPYQQIASFAKTPLDAIIYFALLRDRVRKHYKNTDSKDRVAPDKIVDNFLLYIQENHEQDVIELLKKEPSLEKAEIKSEGSAPNHALQLIEYILEAVPQIQAERPQDFPSMPGSVDKDSLKNKTLDDLWKKAGMTGKPRFVKAFGRKLIFEDQNGDKLVIKLNKRKEPNALLAYECMAFEWGAKQKHNTKELPQPIADEEGEFRFVFDINKCGFTQAIHESLEQASRFSKDKTGHPLELESDEQGIIAIAYKTSRDSRYDEHLTQQYVNKWKDFKEYIIDLTGQLGAYAKQWVVHTTLADMFHNLRGAERNYVVTAGLRTGDLTAGDLENWLGAVMAPNAGPDGIRDYKYLKPIKDILDDPEYRKGDISSIQGQYRDKASNFYMFEFMCRYGMALTLLTGRWQDENDWEGIDWKDDTTLKDLAGFLRESYINLATHHLGNKNKALVEKMAELADWTRYARQMVFFMSDAYVEYLQPPKRGEEDKRKKKFPVENIFGIKRNKLSIGTFGPGTWLNGFVGARPELREVRDKKAIGPFNGPFLITEGLTAAYYIFGLSLAQAALAQAKTQSGSRIKEIQRRFGNLLRIPWEGLKSARFIITDALSKTAGKEIKRPEKTDKKKDILPPGNIINQSLTALSPSFLRFIQFIFTPELKLKVPFQPFRIFGGLVLMLLKIAGLVYFSLGANKKLEAKNSGFVLEPAEYHLVLPDDLTALNFNPDMDIRPLSQRGTFLKRFWRGAGWGDYIIENERLVIFVPDRLLNSIMPAGHKNGVQQFLFDLMVWSQAMKYHHEINCNVDELTSLGRLRFLLSQVYMRFLSALSPVFTPKFISVWHRLWLSQNAFVYLQTILSQIKTSSRLFEELSQAGQNQVLRRAYLNLSRRPNRESAGTFLERLLDILRIQQASIEALKEEDSRIKARQELMRSFVTFSEFIRLSPLFHGQVVGSWGELMPGLKPEANRIRIPDIGRLNQTGAYLDILHYLGVKTKRPESIKQRHKVYRLPDEAA